MKSVLKKLLAAGCCLFSAQVLGQESSQDIDESRFVPLPGQRQTHRTLLATEIGGWSVYTGQMHNHTRGHGYDTTTWPWEDDSAVLAFSKFAQFSEMFGYDFMARTNHTTSRKGYDEDRGFFESVSGPYQTTRLVFAHGIESHLDGDDDPTGHRNHYMTYNGWARTDGGNMEDFADEVLSMYNSDYRSSIHVQFNHPDETGATFYQLPSDPVKRAKLRDVVKVSEVTWAPDGEVMAGIRAYFHLLRNGWRISPVSHYDIHADRSDLEERYQERKADGSYLRPYVLYPGIPKEVVDRANFGPEGYDARNDGVGRTGMVAHQTYPWSSAQFLRGLHERRTFRTTIEGAAGMYTANGQVMGDEFAVENNQAPLTFKVWGRALPVINGSSRYFKRVELWSPSRPGEPIKVHEFNNTTTTDFATELFSLIPYESVYLVRLVGPWDDSDVLLAPVWITNPTPKLRDLGFLFPGGRGDQLLMWSGGGPQVAIQRARVNSPGDPKVWETVAEIQNIGRWGFNADNEAVYTYWRVVDPTDTQVPSNETLLTLPNRQPLGNFEEIVVSNGHLRGWSFDPDMPGSQVRLHVYKDGPAGQGGTFIGEWTTGVHRPDVQQTHGVGASSGFDFPLPVDASEGTHSYHVYALDTQGGYNPLLPGGPRSATFRRPLGSFDQLNTAEGTLVGWALDFDTLYTPLTLHVYARAPYGAGGEFVMTCYTGLPRADVQGIYGIANTGFNCNLPIDYRRGSQTFYIYALDTTGGYHPQLSQSPRTAQLSIPITSARGSYPIQYPQAAYQAVDGAFYSAWSAPNTQSQWVEFDFGSERLIKRIAIRTANEPAGVAVMVSREGSTGFGTQDSFGWGANSPQTVQADYRHRSGGGLMARKVRLEFSGAVPGFTSYSLPEVWFLE